MTYTLGLKLAAGTTTLIQRVKVRTCGRGHHLVLGDISRQTPTGVSFQGSVTMAKLFTQCEGRAFNKYQIAAMFLFALFSALEAAESCFRHFWNRNG